jgi:N-sulfoglucosamine sulfohydrolase
MTTFTRRAFLALCVLLTLPSIAETRPNLLLITVDDMSADSMGIYGCPVKETTPHMDDLARSGFRFERAHTVVANCKPSRNVMWSGRYPHTNGVEGFYKVKNTYPVLCDLYKDAGYFTGIRGKVAHSTPYVPYGWDSVLDTIDEDKPHLKDPGSYGRSLARGIKLAEEAKKPFCLMINISDPHKPFYTGPHDPFQPSQVFTATDIVVPGFLPDAPSIRKEIALYYSSVRRADDCVGELMQILKASGHDNTTIVVFVSDHGMPFPFAKTAVWHHSTHTPWIIRWPGNTRAGDADNEHMVSMIDMLPTLLDMTGIPHPAGVQGRSVVPILKGMQQEGRDYIIKEYNENAGGGRNPMRSIQGKRFMYNFNPWVNGVREFKTATRGTETYRTMKIMAGTDQSVAERVALFEHGTLEELYDINTDPDALVNLANNPEYAEELEKLRRHLAQWMEQTQDHALTAFQHRDNPEIREAYVSGMQKKALARKHGQQDK